jgi:hypothetical protein
MIYVFMIIFDAIKVDNCHLASDEEDINRQIHN